jgi:hypothetical protein
MFTASGKLLAIVALLLSALLLTACGESAQEKATAEVCDARADISKQINTLTGVSASVSAPAQMVRAAEAIAGDLTKLRKAEVNLQPARKEQVQAATHTFEKQLSAVLTGLASSLSLSNAETQLKSALNKLVTSYKQTLAPLSCS